MPLAGRPMVEWSIAAMRAAAGVAAIVVACPPRGGRASHRYAKGTTTAAGGGGAWEGVTRVEGGATRAGSVANALEEVGTELVAIHDAARPLVTPELVEAVVATLLAAPGADGAIAAAPVADTLKRVQGTPATPPAKPKPASSPEYGADAGLVVESTVDREGLWVAQTPQVFRLDALRRALEAAGPERVEAATDEAMLIEAAGGRVLIHPTPAENLKVTTPADLRLAGLLLDR